MKAANSLTASFSRDTAPLGKVLNVRFRQELMLNLRRPNVGFVLRSAIFPAPVCSRGVELLNGKGEYLRAFGSKHGINHGIVCL